MRRELALFSHWIAAKKGKNTKAQSFSDRWRDESFGPWRFTGRGFGIQTWAYIRSFGVRIPGAPFLFISDLGGIVNEYFKS